MKTLVVGAVIAAGCALAPGLSAEPGVQGGHPYFEPAQGSCRVAASFVGHAGGQFVTVEPTALAVHDRRGGEAIRLAFRGAVGARLSGEGPAGHSSYFLGADPASWRPGVPRYDRVRIEGLYPGVDLLVYGHAGGEVEYDLLVAPGADPSVIEIEVEGAVRSWVGPEGSLWLESPSGLLEQLLSVYAEDGRGARRELPARFAERASGRFAIVPGRTRPGERLVIDPVLCYSSYLGGSRHDQVTAAIADSSGSFYVVGRTESADVPGRGAVQPDHAGGRWDGFVARYDPAGALVFVTYVGGSGAWDEVGDVALGPSGTIWLAGSTDSADFPLRDPLQDRLQEGPGDAFVLALEGSGTALLFSTYLGGTWADSAQAIALDGRGRILVSGQTSSRDFPVTPGAFQTVHDGPTSVNSDAFLLAIAADLGGIDFATFLGGSQDEDAVALAVDREGAAVVTGSTESEDFPLSRPIQSSYADAVDAFVAKLSPDGSALEFSTFLGGAGPDRGTRVVYLDDGSIVAAGGAGSTFPLRDALQPTFGGGAYDGFVVRLDPAAPALLFSTYLGGAAVDGVSALARGADGTLVLGGRTDSPDFPTVRPLQAAIAGGADGFVARMAEDGSRLISSTYLGGEGFDLVRAVSADPSGDVLVAGDTGSLSFPLANAAQAGYGGGIGDGFVARIGCWLAASAGPDRTLCEGSAGTTLDASGTTGCPVGARHRWLEGTTVLCDWSPDPTCPVAPAATTIYTVEVECPGCAGACADGASATVLVEPDPLPPDQGNVLRAVRRGDDVALAFAGAPAQLWRLYRDDDPRRIGSSALVPDAEAPAFVDPGAVASPPVLSFYALRGLSPCSRTPGP